MMTRFAIIIILLIIQSTNGIAQHNIIPIPVNYNNTEETFVLDKPLYIAIQTNDEQTIKYVEQFQKHLVDRQVNVATTKSGKMLFVTLGNQPDIGNEGYLLNVERNKIMLTANQSAGIFNGLQTLKQLLPNDRAIKTKSMDNNPITIAGCKIVDYPRFGWRGLMMDVSRHFFSVADVKIFIDKMSNYKFNVFHWHLTDDQGWRIEIKSLPKLTEVGAWRVARHGGFGSNRSDPKPGEEASYGGFYTQEQIKEIVQYAADRNITIVPEIDIPGHSMAALAAYPELSTKKEPKFVNPGTKFAKWFGNGKFEMLIENTLNPTDEKVYEFVDKVFTEIAALFPGEYIHMGGDEAYHGYWEKDKKVIQFMKKNQIKDSHELQSYFVKRVEKIINSKGKKMIGWDEILEGGLADNAAVMSWQGMKGGIAAAKMKHKVVMSPTTYAYLDYTQGDRTVENSVYASLSLEKSYTFDPLPEGVEPMYILGGQANLWAEKVPTLPFAFYMTYPRAFAIAESVWSPKECKNWDNFIQRTMTHFDRFDSERFNICKAVYEPKVRVYKEGSVMMCELTNSVPNTDIYYTIDNTYPPRYGNHYTEPFEVPVGKLSLRTQTYRLTNEILEPIGRELIIDRKILEKRLK